MARAVAKMLTAAQQRCDELGVRLTPQRRQVMAMLLDQDGPRSAYELLDLFKQQHQENAKPPTIYRALDFLVEAGLAHRLASTNQYLACDHLTCHHGHEGTLFLVCDRCGAASEAPMSEAFKQSLQHSLVGQSFAMASRPMLELHGCCSDCQSAE